MIIPGNLDIEILVKLLISTGFGAVIGFERERSHKSAGLRTHSLVSLGSTLLTVIAIASMTQFNAENYDPSRIISNIIVGVGFIGGGAILRSGSRITGTTTAASLWLVATLGIAVGMGFYYEAIATTAIVYFILTAMHRLEKKLSSQPVPGENFTRDVIFESDNEEI